MSPTNIQMVDLKGQYQKIKSEINNKLQVNVGRDC